MTNKQSSLQRVSERVIGFNIIYQQFIAMYDIGCQVCCNWSSASTPMYHTADKHDTPPSHFILTPGQPDLF